MGGALASHCGTQRGAAFHISHLQLLERSSNAYENELHTIAGPVGRVIVPDYECWKKTGGAFYEHTKPGDEVDICLVPWHCPRYDSPTCFHWVYRVAYRRPGSSCYPTYQRNDGCWLGEWDFGLVECTKYHYDFFPAPAHQMKGRFLL